MDEHDATPPVRRPEELADGFCHDLTPLEPFDVSKADSASALLRQLSRTAFGGRQLGLAADVFYEMATDPDCFVVGTFSGAMTVAKMGRLIADMIDHELIDAVVTTGALLCHGLVEQTGHTHFAHDPRFSDEELFAAGYDRVYDTLELERNLYDVEQVLIETLETLDPDQPFGTHELCATLGQRLRRQSDAPGILQSAAARGVPVYIPAFTDCELGLDLFTYNFVAELTGERRPVRFDPLRDVRDFFERISAAKRVGVFTIGGGVPRNWAQQAGPLGEVLAQRTGGKVGRLVRYHYGVRICPEPVHWGGLSGCTYSEGVSWGKFVPPSEGGRFAEVPCDATIAWPILVRAVLERLHRVE